MTNKVERRCFIFEGVYVKLCGKRKWEDVEGNVAEREGRLEEFAGIVNGELVSFA